MIKSALDTKPDSVIDADIVIIGLGAGGSMAFSELAEAGFDVVGLELGAYIKPEEMVKREEIMMPKLFLDGAARATNDMSIRILQGKGVGGSTLHNTNLCKRLNPETLTYWAKKFGLENLLDQSLQDDFKAVETLLNVHSVPDEQVNKNLSLIHI